jgi:hypothetical protein
MFDLAQIKHLKNSTNFCMFVFLEDGHSVMVYFSTLAQILSFC